MSRRRALMSNNADSFPMYLYNDGVISHVVQDFTTDGYKYGESFAQSKGSSYLRIYSTSQYNIRGGRTYTTQLPIPISCIGKTLHVTGTQVNSAASDLRNSKAYVFISESVITTSNTENVISSGSFVNNIQTSQDLLGASTTINIHLTLSITQAGYISIVGYKGYSGNLNMNINKIWIE